MADKEDIYRLVSLLALELDSGDISLPSLPEVVLKIREMLEKDDCDFEKVSMAVSADPVLVSRLFVFANSALHNRANVRIETLDAAIGRLGFELVRNTAMSLAIEQEFVSADNRDAARYQRAVWARSMKLSSMAYAVAEKCPQINEETAFLCGSLHEIGKLYIITKAREFPGFLDDASSFRAVTEEWNAQISKSIIEAWHFASEIAESADAEHYLDVDPGAKPDYVDAMFVAAILVDASDVESLNLTDIPSCGKLGIDEKSIANVMTTYRDKLTTMQQSFS